MEALAKPPVNGGREAFAAQRRRSALGRFEWPPDMNAHDALPFEFAVNKYGTKRSAGQSTAPA